MSHHVHPASSLSASPALDRLVTGTHQQFEKLNVSRRPTFAIAKSTVHINQLVALNQRQDAYLRRHLLGPEDLPWQGTPQLFLLLHGSGAVERRVEEGWRMAGMLDDHLAELHWSLSMVG